MRERPSEVVAGDGTAGTYAYLRSALEIQGATTARSLLRAIHLAAHAVAGAACGATYGPLRLSADPDAPCAFEPPSDVAGRGPARNGTEAAIITMLAGSEAETLAASGPVGACHDVTRWLTDGDPAEAQPYIEWLRLKAARTVEHPLRQRVILALGRALLEGGALSAAAATSLEEAEVARYMRGE